MKPKKQVALKLKTLTLTLGLVAGMSAGTAMGYTSTDPAKGKLVQDMYTGIEGLLKDYDEKTSYLAPVTETDTTKNKNGTGVYGALGNQTLVSTDKPTIGGINITGTGETAVVGTPLLQARRTELLGSAKLLDDGAEKFAEGFNPVSDTEVKVTVLKAVFDAIVAGTMDKDGDANSVAIIESIANSANPSTVAVDKTAVEAIDNLNFTMDALYKVLYTDANAIGKDSDTVDGFKGVKLASPEAFKKLTDYVAAYVDYGTTALTAATKANMLNTGEGANGTVDENKLSEFAKKVVGLFHADSGDTQAQKNIDENVEIKQLASDDQLAEAIKMSDADLVAKVAVAKGATADQTELVILFEAARKEGNADKKAALVNEAVEKLVPNARSTFGAVSGASKTVTGNVGDHLKVMQAGGVNSGDSDYADGNVWLRMNYLQQTVDAQDAAPGYKQKSMGFGIGVDQPLNDKFTMGLAYNFVRSDVDGEDGYLREDDVKSHGFGGYVTMMHDNLFADAQINYVKNKVDGFRKITTDASKISYKYDADVLNAMIGLGMHVDLENHWYAKPKLCFAFANHKTDKYNEEGSTLVSTDIDAASHQSSEVGLQLTVGADLMMDNYKVMPKLNMGFMYDMNDKKDKVTFAFMGDNSFVAEGPKRDRSNFNLGVGAGFMMENVTLSLDYGFNWSSNTKTHGISAKLGCMF